MTSEQYIQNAMRTEGRGNYRFGPTGELSPRMEHAVYGLVTEAGELMDEVKRVKIYGKDLDRTNLLEEAGDCFWYLALLCDELGVSFEDVWEKNIAKLRARYPEKWTAHHALNRNHAAERAQLE